MIDALPVKPGLAPSLDKHPHFVRNRDVMLRWMEGQEIADIAAAKGITVVQVKAVLKQKWIRKEVHRLSQLANDRYLKERIDGLTIEALDTIRDTMRGMLHSDLRFKAAKEILDKSPVLQEKRAGLLEEIAIGVGEAIITRLAQLESQAAVEKQVVDINLEEKTKVRNEAKDEDLADLDIPVEGRADGRAPCV